MKRFQDIFTEISDREISWREKEVTQYLFEYVTDPDEKGKSKLMDTLAYEFCKSVMILMKDKSVLITDLKSKEAMKVIQGTSTKEPRLSDTKLSEYMPEILSEAQDQQLRLWKELQEDVPLQDTPPEIAKAFAERRHVDTRKAAEENLRNFNPDLIKTEIEGETSEKQQDPDCLDCDLYETTECPQFIDSASLPETDSAKPNDNIDGAVEEWLTKVHAARANKESRKPR